MKKLVLAIILISTTVRAHQPKFPDENPLVLATVRGNLSKVKKLVKSGFDINSSEVRNSTFKWTAIFHAVHNQDYEIVEFLLDQPQLNLDYRDEILHATVLHWAAGKEDEDPEMVKLLLTRKDIDINAIDAVYKLSPLGFAVEAGNIKVIRVFLNQPGILFKDVVDSSGLNLWDLAYRTWVNHEEQVHKEIMKLLKEVGVKPLYYKDRL